MNTTEIAYLAGIIDGEGCISLAVRKKIYVTPTLQVTNTSRQLIDWLLLLGGTSYARKDDRPTRRESWLWRTAGDVTRNIVRMVRPYLKIKSPQADIILGMETIGRTKVPRDNSTGRLTRLSPEYHRAVADALAKIRFLNRRGRVISSDLSPPP